MNETVYNAPLGAAVVEKTVLNKHYFVVIQYNNILMAFSLYIPVLVNPRRACAARVTVVGLSV